jgi:hypothetical protein
MEGVIDGTFDGVIVKTFEGALVVNFEGFPVVPLAVGAREGLPEGSFVGDLDLGEGKKVGVGM